MAIKLINYGGYMPLRKHHYDVGADVYTYHDIVVKPHETVKIPLGFGIMLPNCLSAFIYPRSSIAMMNIGVQLSPIDPGYTGEVHAIVTNYGNKTILIKEATAIGQLVILPNLLTEFSWIDPDKVEKTERGSGAFGSTGKPDIKIID